MAELKCPNCGTLISLQQSDLDSVVKQVRDEQFEQEIAERVKLMEAEKNGAVELAKAEARAQIATEASEKDARIAELEAQVKAAARQAASELKARIAEQEARAEAELVKTRAQKDAEIEMLRQQAASQSAAFNAEKELAVAQAVSAVERQRDEFAAAVELKEAERIRIEADLKEQLIDQANAKDQMIAFQQEEIERLKDMKARLSTKMVGESLEQHCQYEFERIRSVAFPNAYFDKDNDASQGTKGDFIFREVDEEGNEVISIMFEMKNLGESDSVKKRNEDHFAKLDRDRTKKGCEYAILVSLLEPENELYNEGIVDVSHRFPKMYVIRPQFFIPIISLLRNAALSSMAYKRELALVRQQELDITNFERDLDVFKQGFFRNFELAGERFDDAIEGIEKTIKLLEKIRDNLTKSEKHLVAANHKLEDLTVKKLTRNNPTMKKRFEELGESPDEEPDA